MSQTGYAITVDLGTIKVFAINKSEQNSVSLKAMQLEENLASQAKTSEIVTDKAGENANSVSGGNSSYESKTDLEIKSRSIDNIGQFLNQFIEQHDGDIFLAVSDPIHSKVDAKLNPNLKVRITKSLPKNLTQQSTDQIIKAFAL